VGWKGGGDGGGGEGSRVGKEGGVARDREKVQWGGEGVRRVGGGEF